MRDVKLADAIGKIDGDLIEAADVKIKMKKKKSAGKIVLIAACIAVLICAIAVPAVIIADRAREKAESQVSVDRIMPGDEMGFARMAVSTVIWNGKEYVERNSAIPTEKRGEDLGKSTITIQEITLGNDKTLEGTVYSVVGIKPEIAIAFYSEDWENIHLLVNSDFVPATLGDFIDAVSLRENLTTGEVYDMRDRNTTYVYGDIPTETVWAMLLDCTDVKNEPDAETGERLISIASSVELLGIYDLTIGLTDDGYLWTNILDTGKYFNIGKEKVNAFLKELEKYEKTEFGEPVDDADIVEE